MVGAAPLLRRGEVWWVDFGQSRGSAPALRRPAVVLQCDPLNQSRLATVVVVAVSSNLVLVGHPGNVLLHGSAVGLPKDSVANVTQIATVDRAALVERVGAVPHAVMARVEAGVRVTLALP